MDLLNNFDDLRMQRMHLAQEFVQHSNGDELLADVANLLALLYAANNLAKQPKGFVSDTKWPTAST